MIVSVRVLRCGGSPERDKSQDIVLPGLIRNVGRRHHEGGGVRVGYGLWFGRM